MVHVGSFAKFFMIDEIDFITASPTEPSFVSPAFTSDATTVPIEWTGLHFAMLSPEYDELIRDFKERVISYKKALFSKKIIGPFRSYHKPRISMKIPSTRNFKGRESSRR